MPSQPISSAFLASSTHWIPLIRKGLLPEMRRHCSRAHAAFFQSCALPCQTCEYAAVMMRLAPLLPSLRAQRTLTLSIHARPAALGSFAGSMPIASNLRRKTLSERPRSLPMPL